MKNQNLQDSATGVQGRSAAGNEARLLEQARDSAAKGNGQAAERILRQLLDTSPKSCQGHCLLADLLAATGRPAEAVRQLQLAIQLLPGEAAPCYSLAVIHLNQNQLDLALAASRKAIGHKPDFAEAHALQGIILRRAGRTGEAAEAYARAIAIKPDYLDAYQNLGVALTELGRYQEAAEQYQKILDMQPDHVASWHGLGLCMDWLGDLEQAAACYERALCLDPAHIGSWNNVASVYLAQNRLQKSLEAFRRSAELKFDHGRPLKGPLNMILHRIRHDAEQLRYIDAKSGISAEYQDYLQALTGLETRHTGKPGTEKVMVDAQTTQRIAPSFNRILHRIECPELPGGALNPEVDWAACESSYLNATPEVVTIDQFLRPEALQSLRDYCLESTVWKTVRPYGYMGTLIADGFATPLLLQIITELRERMPGILSAHHLTQAWAYKYDSSLRAINIHADCAAVNINFWITPDSANQNPDNGGLVLWDKAPPPDWGLLRTQNPDKTEIKQFLETSGARTITVPHRQNRMVLFNSALFHKSDEMDFVDGYENRRINVTLLYGNGLR